MILPDVNILVAAYRDDVSDTDNTSRKPATYSCSGC